MRWPNGWAATRWRENVLATYDHQCAVQGCDGEDLQAHHTYPMRHAGPDALAPGIALCRKHHQLADASNREGYETVLGMSHDTLRKR